ncbi:RAMP superfamily CRISPR-associated protein [Shouchella rhizosphaerae]|uniref:RAMP superfamily CRISPR-associated protein n=1 Tax=Shouchella rhizosphaerae TaxID=866786 RepID=UPI003F7E0356
MAEKNNSNPISFRTCVLLEGELASPLLAGSGEEEYSDNDTVVDQYGCPFVPGSALAGVFRHQLKVRFPDELASIEELFGKDENQSRLYVYSMMIKPKAEEGFSIRDGVKLDQYKTATDQGKYNMRVVERGATWKLRFEWIEREKDQNNAIKEELLCQLIEGLMDGTITIGAKTNRGFGKLEVARVAVKTFDHKNCKQASKSWLDWNWNDIDDKQWLRNETSLKNGPRTHLVPQEESSLRVPLLLDQTLMIRTYSKLKRVSGDEQLQAEQPDYEQLKVDHKAVIPGTTWAGAIRSRIKSMLVTQFSMEQGKADNLLEELFGTWTKGTSSTESLKASRVRIEESVVEGGEPFPITRNAIDRFTGGTVDGALYTGEPWVNGKSELILRWSNQSTNQGSISNEAIGGMLLWAIKDLQEGLLAVGGETSVGRGIFMNDSNYSLMINGQKFTDESTCLRKAAQTVKEWNA